MRPAQPRVCPGGVRKRVPRGCVVWEERSAGQSGAVQVVLDKVIDGMDVVDAIAACDIDAHSGAPTGEMPRMVGGIKPVKAE